MGEVATLATPLGYLTSSKRHGPTETLLNNWHSDLLVVDHEIPQRPYKTHDTFGNVSPLCVLPYDPPPRAPDLTLSMRI
jgi:hypothetical protein